VSTNRSLIIAGELFPEKLCMLAKDTSLHVAYPDGIDFAIVPPSGQSRFSVLAHTFILTHHSLLLYV
jgi:hypothetical protein